MDLTVTAPLDMGTGQQRYVVAYTLKQGTEKQPDILNAQKSEINHLKKTEFHNMHSFFFFSISTFKDSESAQSFKAVATTPPLLRPDALFLTKFVSENIQFDKICFK